MVKCHKNTGQPRHFRKNQRKHSPARVNGNVFKCCETCRHRLRGSGDRYNRFGYSQGMACFNKDSKYYMHLVYGHPSCQKYEIKL